MKLLVASIALYVLLLLVHLALRLTSYLGFLTLAGAVQLVAAVLMLIGCWKLTTPDPGKLKTAVWLDSRRVTCAAAVTVFVLSVTSVFAGVQMTGDIRVSGRTVIGLVLATVVVLLVATFATFIYARQLAIRIPNTRLANFTRWVMWGCAASLVAVVPISWVVLLMLVMSGMAGIHPRDISLTGVAITLLIGACIAMLTLAILSLALVIRYMKAFNQAARQARATWAA